MAQFPFAHNITMTYRLANGVLEVETTIENLSDRAAPCRDRLSSLLPPARRAARSMEGPSRRPRPHGSEQLPDPHRREVPERVLPTRTRFDGAQLDDVFTNLSAAPTAVRISGWRAKRSGSRSHTVPSTPSRWSTPRRRATSSASSRWPPITNAFNLAHSGAYKDLQSVAPGGTWKESFWIGASGF